MTLKISPSSIDRYARCPGSYWAEQGIQDQESSFAAEGRMLHDVMAGKLPVTGLTSEQKRLITKCSEHGQEVLAKHLGNGRVTIEKERQLQVQCGDILLSGIHDLTARDDQTVVVVDYKFGRTAVESAASNKQMRAYALMAWMEWCADVDGQPKPNTVVIAIIQPTVDRDNQVTVAAYGPDDITQAYEELGEIGKAIQACERTNNARYPGPVQCKYCRALGTKRCPESSKVAEGLVKITPESLLPTGYPLADLWEQCRMIEPLIERVKQHAKAEARAGRMPGWVVSDPKPERSLPDTAAAWERVQDVLDSKEFIGLTKIGVGDLQEALQKKLNWTVKGAAKEFNTLLGAAIQMKEKDGSLKRDPDWKPPADAPDKIGDLLALAAESSLEDCVDGPSDRIRASAEAARDAGVPVLFSDADETGPEIIHPGDEVHTNLGPGIALAEPTLDEKMKGFQQKLAGSLEREAAKRKRRL